MILLGNCVCAILSLIALGSSVSAATRMGLRPGAELALGSVTLWFAVILLPIHVLGVLEVLWPATLAAASVVFSIVVFLASAHGRTPRAQLSATLSSAQDTLEHARSLFTRVFQAGPLAIAALMALAFALVWATLLTYLLPSDGWDAVWYHDLAVGYALQRHGYSEVDLPLGGFQQAFGYPRNSEMTSLWFVIFADRKLIELPSVLAAIPLALGVYCLCERYGKGSGVASLLWAVAMVLLPGARLQMRTTYVDLLFGAMTVVAFYFASDPDLRSNGRTLMASVAIGLALGSKGQALLTMPFCIIMALAFLISNRGLKEIGRTAALVGVGALVILALGGVTYIQNIVRHHNPLWPIDMKVGPFQFPGTLSFEVFNENGKFDLVDNVLSVPQPGHDYADTKVNGYGMFGFFVFPLALLGVLSAVITTVRLSLTSISERRRDPELGLAYSLVAIAAVVSVSIWKSTAIWLARYNLSAVAVAIVFVHWLSYRFPRRSALTFGAANAAFLTNVMLWKWSNPGWGAPGIAQNVSEVRRLWLAPETTREGASPLINPDMVVLRERELGPGDVVVWTGECNFPSLFWNERFSNVLLYIPPTPQPAMLVEEAERAGARWLVVAGPWADAARARSDHWKEIGVSNQTHSPNAIFRRTM